MLVSPARAGKHPVDGRFANSIFQREESDVATNVPAFNFRYVCAREDGASVALSRSVPLLLDHVGNIVGLRAKEEMTGVAARTIVAPMQNAKAITYGAIRDAVSKAMGVSLLANDLKMTVSQSGNNRPPPLPAGARAMAPVDESPERSDAVGSKFCSLVFFANAHGASSRSVVGGAGQVVRQSVPLAIIA